MAGIVNTLEYALLDKLLSEEAPLAMKSDTMENISTACVLFACVGIGFLIYGAHLRLIGSYSPDLAAALTGGISLLFSLLIVAAVYFFLKYRESRIRKFRQGITKRIESTLLSFSDELEEPIRDNPKTALLLAAMAGFALEKRIL